LPNTAAAIVVGGEPPGAALAILVVGE